MEYYIDPVTFVTQKSGFESRYIKNLLGLLDEGATIPFISRYRKEMTGSMDEVQVGQVREIYEQFKELEKRKKTVLESIELQEKLTPELRKQIEHCTDLRELEDIYLPYKPKKQTRASKAKAKGLEPLAAMLMKQDNGDVWDKAARFVKNDVENGTKRSRSRICFLRMPKRLCRVLGILLPSGSARMTGQETPCVALLTGWQ